MATRVTCPIRFYIAEVCYSICMEKHAWCILQHFKTEKRQIKWALLKLIKFESKINVNNLQITWNMTRFSLFLVVHFLYLYHPFWCRNITGKICQYHSCCSHGSLRRQVISSPDIWQCKMDMFLLSLRANLKNFGCPHVVARFQSRAHTPFVKWLPGCIRYPIHSNTIQHFVLNVLQIVQVTN